MTPQRDFLDGPDQIPQGVLLPFQNIRGSFRLPKRLEIVLEQAADPTQFRNGTQVCMSHQRSASEKTPPHVFRQGQSGDFRLLHEARFFSFGDADRHPFPRGAPTAVFRLSVFHALAFGMREAKRRAFRESRGRQPSGRMGLWRSTTPILPRRTRIVQW